MPAGEDFDKLPITYVIFITENDVFGGGKAVYEIERTIKNYDHVPVADDSHILFVNGSYVDDDDIGKLMHDFRCTKADDMYYEWMARATRYYKETPEGVSYMCKTMEDRIKENVQIAEYSRSVEIALSMLEDGTMPLEKIANMTKLPLEEAQQLADEHSKSN